MTLVNAKTILMLFAIVTLILPVSSIAIAEKQNPPIGTTQIDVEEKPRNGNKTLKDLDRLQNIIDETSNEFIKKRIQILMDNIIERQKQNQIQYTIEERIQQEILVDKISDEFIEKKIPFTKIGFSDNSNSIVVSMHRDHTTFNTLNDVAQQTRTIIGSEVNLIIENGGDYFKPLSCDNRTSNCNPIESGVSMQVENHTPCTVGFKATYNGKSGFVTAGHCANDDTGSNVGQSTTSNIIGIVEKETYTIGAYNYCDCAFIESNMDVASIIHGISSTYYPDHTSTAYEDDYVKQSGFKSGIRTGQIENWSGTINYWDGTSLRHVAIATFSAEGGDSGAPVMEAYSSDPGFLGTVVAGNNYNTAYVKYYKYDTDFPGISWGN